MKNTNTGSLSTKNDNPYCRVAEVVGQCFFVGMHNKPGMKPLDSKTMSGKLIDAIIFRLPFTCIKTNLCEVDYMPTDKEEIWEHNLAWDEKYNPVTGSIIILLGDWVNKNFMLKDCQKIIKLAHPASCYGRVNKEKYVLNAISKINQMI